MLIIENVKLALQALWSNKMRSLLTMLGIIIGIGSVIAIMTVSASLSGSISDSFQEMGANNITVGLSQKESEGESTNSGLHFGSAKRQSEIAEEDLITDEMIGKLQKNFSQQMEAVALSESVGSATAEEGENSANLSITGINKDYFKSTKVTLLNGRNLTQKDVDGKKHVILLSDKAVENLYDGDNDKALAKALSIQINGTYETYYVVGIYKYEQSGSISSSSSSDITTTAYIPLTTAKEQMRSDAGYSQFTIVTASNVDVESFATIVKNFLSRYYRSNDNYEISTSTMTSMMESMNEMIGTVSIAIAFIAGISLLVGGIGVMNIMLVSITERTKEIGTRKALGAKNSSIRLQFIVESVILCMIGGMIGILLGLTIGNIAASVLGYSAAAPLGASILSVAFSMMIGVFFGFYPANKAARMNPIDALRYE